MKGLIIEKGEKYYTYLKKYFLQLNDMQRNYNWLITAHECYPQNEKYAKIWSEIYCWMTGDELTEMVSEDFQWIWGVLSAFPKDIPKEKILQYELPKADGYEGFWRNPVSMQHPLAEIEIVAWDSSLTIFISKDERIIDMLQESNVLAEDLEKYNEWRK